MAAKNETQDHSHHIIPIPVYNKVFAVLLLMTVITVLAAQLDFGAMNTVIAFGIATFKAILVASIFMHLKYDDKMNRVIIVSSVFFLIVLWFFTILDEVTRVVTQSTL